MEPKFLVLGHASETYIEFQNRPRLPPGYTLLLSTECDRQTKTENVQKVIELASRSSLNFTKFRVYKEGDAIPNLNLLLLDDHEISEGYISISRSGVYSVPLGQEFTQPMEWIERYWTLNKETGKASYWSPHVKVSWELSQNQFDFFDNYMKNTIILSNKNPQVDDTEIQFSGAVYPGKKELQQIFSTSDTLPKLKTALQISLEDLFKKLGPGTYIVPLCRSVEIEYGEKHDDLFEYIHQEIYPDLEKRLTFRKNKNRLKYREQKYNLLTNLKNHPKFQEEPWKGILQEVRADVGKSIRILKNTRSKSAMKQRGGKTRRKH